MAKCLNVPTRRVSSIGGEGFGEFNATLLRLFSDEDFIQVEFILICLDCSLSKISFS